MSTRPIRRCKPVQAEGIRSLKIEVLERRELLAWSSFDSTLIANDRIGEPIPGFISTATLESQSIAFDGESTKVNVVGSRFNAGVLASSSVEATIKATISKFEETDSFPELVPFHQNQLTAIEGCELRTIRPEDRRVTNVEIEVDDAIAPVVTSFVVMPTAFPAMGTDHIVFLATFSEAVTGVDAADFVVVGTDAKISVKEISPSTYEITVSGSDMRCNSGSIGLNLVASTTITDMWLNGLTNAEPEIDIEFGIDEPPKITSVIATGSLWGAAFIDAVDGGGTGAGNGLGYLLTSELILPNMGVDRIYIQFSEPVIGFNASNFMLTGVLVPSYSAISSVSYDALTMRGIVQLSSSIARDKLRIRVSEAVTDLGLNALDGDSNGIAGGEFDFRFNVLVGDASADGSVNGGDLTHFGSALNSTAGSGTYDHRADWNAGGSITADSDLSFYISSFNKSLPSAEPGTQEFVP